MASPKNTSWGHVASWYEKHLSLGKGTFHHDVILPNITRLMQIEPGMNVLDMACGSGYFAEAWHEAGARVTGVDIAKELIATAKKAPHGSEITYHVGSAHDVSMLKDIQFDRISFVLALQNIADVAAALKECARLLSQKGRLLIVLNHPAYRIPKKTSWEYDEILNVQYRRVEAYLSESSQDILMHPGAAPSLTTVSFHRPLQYYMKAAHKQGLALTRLEEWISNREGPQGKRFQADERARKEIPLFLFLEFAHLS